MRPCARLAMVLGLFLAVADASAADVPLRPWSGSPKPLFALKELDGPARALDQQRGRVVLVHFFATWCEPCIPEMTALRTLVEKQPKVAVLAIDVGEVEDRVRRFFARLPMNFPILLDADRAVTKAWNVHGLPATFVLDATLTPRFFAEGAVDWTSADVRRLLESLTPQAELESQSSMSQQGG